MEAEGLVSLGTIGLLDRPDAISSRPEYYEPTKLPLRTRALSVIGFSILAWLPIISIGYVISVRI